MYTCTVGKPHAETKALDVRKEPKKNKKKNNNFQTNDELGEHSSVCT